MFSAFVFGASISGVRLISNSADTVDLSCKMKISGSRPN